MNILLRLYWRLCSPEKYARKLGVTIGENCLIDTRNWSSEPYLITIGNNVQITKNVFIHTHGGGNSIRRLSPNFDVFGKVIIEDYAYIGAGSHILPGVTIGRCAIVGAGSVVTKSVPANMVVAGNPAKVICSIGEYLQKNLKYNTNTKGMDSDMKKRCLLSLPDEMFIKK